MHHWIYHRLTEDVDRQIGMVLGALRDEGLDDKTIVIFTSDHGDMDGAHQRIHKSYFYEESARVPFIVAALDAYAEVIAEHRALVERHVQEQHDVLSRNSGPP